MSDSATTTGIKFKIDGEDYTARPGETVLAAALRNGVHIPHYCWHPGLSIAGNCRMCLVYSKPGPPKPIISCSTHVREGMEIEVESERVHKDREGILEFLLINHPLDCAVCDQAGECDLQQYSFDHGRAESKFVEGKTQFANKDFGPLIRFNGNRCIVCTRCVRFCDEVTQTQELAVVNRTDHATIDVFPGVPLDNPLSGCTADLCPVGALLEKDSLHSTRVWLLRGTKSVCGACATGCNINVETSEDRHVMRLTPRENQAVNKWWMCDHGRVSHRESESPTRLRVARIDGVEATGQDALAKAATALQGLKDGQVAGLVSGFATNEELLMLKTLVGGGPLGAGYRPDGESFKTFDGFSISPDKNPNRAGVKRILGAADDNTGTGDVRSALTAGRIAVLIVLDGAPASTPWDEDLIEATARAETRIVISLEDTALAQEASVSFPGLHWTEKDGTFENDRGRLQRVRAGIPSSGARSDLEILQELALAQGLVPRVVSAGGVFRRLAAAQPAFEGITYRAIGEVGLPLKGASDQTPAELCRTGYEAGPWSRSPGRADDEQVRLSIHRESPAGFGTHRGDN